MSMPLLSLLLSPQLCESISSTFSFVLHACILFILGILLNVPGPSLKVILLNVNRPECRGTATAVGEFFNNCGRIIGPIIFTYLEREKDRINALLTVSNFFFISSAFSFMLRMTIEKDEEDVNEYIHNVKISHLSSEAIAIDMKCEEPKITEDVPLLHA